MSSAATVPGSPAGPNLSAPRPLRRAPERREMALIAGLAFFLNLFPGTGLQFLDARWGLVASQTAFILGPVLLALRWFYLDHRSVLPFGRPAPAAMAFALLATLALNHLLTIASAWQERVFPSPQIMRDLFAGLFVYRGPVDFAHLLVSFAVVPAVCEEVLFRGFLLAGLLRWLERPARAITASAFIFALFHLDPWRFAGILALGVFLGYLAHASGSLVLPILAHALNNAVSIGLAAAGIADGVAPSGSAPTAALAAALLIAALLMLRRAPAGRAGGGVI